MTVPPSDQIVRVGVGVIVFNRQGQFLMGRRRNAHGLGTWAIIGGHLEHGESFEGCARRETLEETGLALTDVETLGVANHIFASGKHYVSVYLAGRIAGADETTAMDPREFAEWRFFDDWAALPQPLFVPYDTDVKASWLAGYRDRHGVPAVA